MTKTKTTITPEIFEDANEFVSNLRLSHARWETYQDSWHNDWIFRGQRDAAWRIEPSAWRDVIESTNPFFASCFSEISESEAWEQLKGYQKYFGGDQNQNAITARRLCAIKRFEYLVVLGFVELADELGFRVPEAKSLVDDAYKYVDPFSSPMKIVANKPIEEFSAAVLLAQHHGIPTRFVDWTRDPIIAACFATQGWTGKTDVAVYAIPKKCANSKNYRLIVPTRFEFGFLHAQEGLFSYRSKADCTFCSSGAWPNIEEELNADLRKLVLKSDCVDELNRILWLERRTKAHLMPTLDNVTKTLNDLWDKYLKI